VLLKCTITLLYDQPGNVKQFVVVFGKKWYFVHAKAVTNVLCYLQL